MMQTTGTLTFAAESQVTVMSCDWQDRPKGWLRLLGPLSAFPGGGMERRIWTGLKEPWNVTHIGRQMSMFA